MKSLDRDVERRTAELGSHLLAWRKVLNLTAEEVAVRADISRGTLRKLENGDGSASLEAALRVARALGIIDTLVDSLDPLRTELGRMRAGLINRQRVR